MEIKQIGDNRAYEFKNHDSNRLIIVIEGSGLHSVLGEKKGITGLIQKWADNYCRFYKMIIPC
jgi:hypothetical protein